MTPSEEPSTATDDAPEPDEPAPDPTPTASAEPSLELVDIFPTDEWCSAASKIEMNLGRASAHDPVGSDAMRIKYELSERMYEQALVVAPDQLSNDLALLRDAVVETAAQLATINYDELSLDLGFLAQAAYHGRIANYRIDRYNYHVCGFDNGFDASADPALEPEPDLTDLVGTNLRASGTVSLMEQGFTFDQAQCLMDNGITDPDIIDSETRTNALFDQCT